MTKPTFTIGADPELFLLNSVNKKYISSIGLIGGSKEKPRDIGRGCAVQEDNVAVEFNIPPCHDLKSFVDSLEYNLQYLQSTAERLGLVLAIDASAEFAPDQLATPASQVFGCDPDYNAWTRSINPRPSANNQMLRSAGGHIHVGFDSSELNFEQVVRAMDLFVGCEMLEFDNDTRRRELYGKAGAFRRKEYGIEYRTASNAWVKSRDLMEWAYNQTGKALEFVSKGKIIPDDGICLLIQECINTSNATLLPKVREWANG